MTEIFTQIVSTIIGAILVALIFFVVKDKFYRLPVVSGVWTFKAATETTSYNPYKGMSLYYLVLLSQEGNRVSGTGEKIKEVAGAGTKEYIGKHRTQIELSGYLVQRLFSADECSIHIREFGESRKSSTIHNLKVMNNSSLDGTFFSTIASQTGRVSWSRGNDSYSFSWKV